MDLSVSHYPLSILFAFAFLAGDLWGGVQAERVYLSGKGPGDAKDWAFYCTEGRRSGEWTTIPVPSNWEMEGFGGYNYGHDEFEGLHAEVGIYRTRFFAPQAWKDKTVRLVFEGAMTETSVKLNGERVGAVHQGGYTPFHIILTSTGRKGRRYRDHAIRFGEENELEVTVSKIASNRSLEMAERDADYWIFGGIYRPVYLEILPQGFVGRVAIDAKASGEFVMDVFPQVHRARNSREPEDFVTEVTAQIETLQGERVGTMMSASLSGSGLSRVRLKTTIEDPEPWSPEFPNLFQVRVKLMNGDEVIHQYIERFGFRTFEVRRGDGLYLNGKRILIRGINRNGFRPDTARALDPEEDWEDARAIKGMNANTVRFHLPPSKKFIEACDELGLLVISEMTTWQGPAIDTPIARNIIYELVTRGHNHPSVVIWANGNEGGFNHEVDETFALLDLQSRPVIHPWAIHDDLDTLHYPTYDRLLQRLSGPHVYLPTEMLHGLYDGGHGAGLANYWDAISGSEVGAGGVLWCWGDAAVVRTDKSRILDTDGNHSADGIVGPYGEEEASYYTVREIWSPVKIEGEGLPVAPIGQVAVRNDFVETDLGECCFFWKTLKYPYPLDRSDDASTLNEGMAIPSSIPPGELGSIDLGMPRTWKDADALSLRVVDPHGRELMEWVWPITARDVIKGAKGGALQIFEQGEIVEVRVGDTDWLFSTVDGRLMSVEQNGAVVWNPRGPVLYAKGGGAPIDFGRKWKTTLTQDDQVFRIHAISTDDGSEFSWSIEGSGLATLNYDFAPIGEPLEYGAVGFRLKANRVLAKRWLGKGPNRVWANRQHGPQFGLWENAYNDGLAGYRWELPEFKGVFADVRWMLLDLRSGLSLLVQTESVDEIGVLRPFNADMARKATWSYPEEDGLFVFHKMSAVGTKFHEARQIGPSSEHQFIRGRIRGRIHFSITNR